MGVSRQTVTDLVHARRPVSANIAERLHRATGVSAQFWLNMEQRYQRDMERQ